MTCKHCGETGLNWHGTKSGMRLGRNGVIHACREFHKRAFKARYDKQPKRTK